MSPSSPHTTDDLTFELLLLTQIAQHRAPALPEAFAAALRESSLWVAPVAVRPRRRPAPVWKAAVLAGLIAFTPLAWLPVYADTQVRVGLSIVDAKTGKAIGGARILGEKGALLGTTGPDGRITLVVPSGATDRFIIEKPGYRSVPVIRTQLRDNNLIAMLPAPKVAPTTRPTPLRPVPIVQATPKATPKPLPTVQATPKATPKPLPTIQATPKATPKPLPTVQATPKPTAKPVKPTAHPTLAPTVAPSPAAVEASPGPLRTPAPETRFGYATHRVRSGDTLWRIAKREYGDGFRWKVIFEANRDVVRQSDLLQPGMILKLPRSTRQMLQPGWVFVHKGDSLYVLAERYLGDGERWPALYRANRKRIKNPRLIHPGQRLFIPGLARRERTTKRR